MKRLFLSIPILALFFLGCHDSDPGNQSRPKMTTLAVTNITSRTASTGGEVVSDGHMQVTERGVCYDTLPMPTDTLASKIPSGLGVGAFTAELTNLRPGTTYYVRAYGINFLGTAYGEQMTFTTNK